MAEKLFSKSELKGVISLTIVMFFRMFGLFVVLPIFNTKAIDFPEATPFLVGIAFGAYGLTQGFFQIPFGMMSDRVSRKLVLVFGLGLFLVGSLICAVSTDIYFLIMGRLIQGLGAVSSVVFALISDVTTPKNRPIGNAFVGSSIGLAFVLAFGVGPSLASKFSLNDYFWLTVGIAFLAELIAIILIPEKKKERPNLKIGDQLAKVLKDTALYPIFAAAGLVGMGMTMFLYHTQLALKQTSWGDKQWVIYIGVVLISLPTIFYVAKTVRKKNLYREIMTFGALLILAATIVESLAFMGFSIDYTFPAAILIFYAGFNFFEPILPAFLTIICDQDYRGTASGVYSFFLFVGNFLGSFIAGRFYDSQPLISTGLYLILGLFFLLLTRRIVNPSNIEGK